MWERGGFLSFVQYITYLFFCTDATVQFLQKLHHRPIPTLFEPRKCYDDPGSFPISHPFGPHGESAGRLFFIKNGRREASRRPDSLSSSAAAAPLAVDAAVQVSHFPLGGGEELLELVLKGLVPGGRKRLLRCPGKIRPGLGRWPRSRGAAGRAGRPGCGARAAPEAGSS